MRIENTGPAARIRGTKSPSKPSETSSRFSLTADPETAEANSAPPTASIANLGALLALQDVDDALNGRRRTAERGVDLLDSLEEIQLGLLSGRLSSAQVTRIAQKVRNLGRAGDESLDSILSDIDMRARVELAKLGVFDF